MSGKVTFFENFEAALTKLIEFQKLYDGSEIHRAGVIQGFEFTFEQCWKALQKKSSNEGLLLASPKKAIEWAMAQSWIPHEKEDTWIEMMADRNLTSHTYREHTAQTVVTRVLDTYITEMTAILAKMKSSI